MEKDLLSVIIPIYNAEKYLRPCIDSLVKQTYGEMEILLVDDGSTDDSASICDEYEKKYAIVRAIHKANGGCSSARNMGVELARGEFLAFVDADDCLDLDFYEILIRELKKHDCQMAGCTYQKELSEDFDIRKKNEKIPTAIVYDSTKNILESITAAENSLEGMVWNKVYRRELTEGVIFRDDVAIVDDAMYTWDMVTRNVTRACYINLPMYHYRIIPSSITRNSKLEKYFKALYAFELMIKSAEDLHIPKCLSGLCPEYLEWNLITGEKIVYLDDPDTESFQRIQTNIQKYREYIPNMRWGSRLKARAALRSWTLFKRTVMIRDIYRRFAGKNAV